MSIQSIQAGEAQGGGFDKQEQSDSTYSHFRSLRMPNAFCQQVSGLKDFPGAGVGTLFYRQLREQGRSVLFCVQDLGGLNALESMISKSLSDETISHLAIHANGLALNRLISNEQVELASFNAVALDGSSAPLEDYLMSLGGVQEVFATLAGEPGPQNFWLSYAKDLGFARKVTLVFDGWSRGLVRVATGGRLVAPEALDSVICQDSLAVSAAKAELPSLSSDKFQVAELTSSASLGLDRGADLRTEGRRHLGINPNSLVVLFIGNAPGQLRENGAGEALLNETWLRTYDSVIALAKEFRTKRFHLIARAHPRDPIKTRYQGSQDEETLPNFSLHADGLLLPSVECCCFAADVVAGIGSTELFKAPLRGRQAVFLDMKSEEVSPLSCLFSPGVIDGLSDRPCTYRATSTENLRRTLINALSL